MIRTASDLFVGAHIREGDATYLVDYLVSDDEGVYIEGYVVESGDEFTNIYDYDDEVNIVKGE